MCPLCISLCELCGYMKPGVLNTKKNGLQPQSASNRFKYMYHLLYRLFKPIIKTLHPSLLTPHSSPLTPHSSPLTPHSSPLTLHSSPLTLHSSLLTPHSSLLTPHSFLLHLPIPISIPISISLMKIFHIIDQQQHVFQLMLCHQIIRIFKVHLARVVSPT